MAEKRPLVQYENGAIQTLKPGDTLPGSGGSTTLADAGGPDTYPLIADPAPTGSDYGIIGLKNGDGIRMEIVNTEADQHVLISADIASSLIQPALDVPYNAKLADIDITNPSRYVLYAIQAGDNVNLTRDEANAVITIDVESSGGGGGVPSVTNRTGTGTTLVSVAGDGSTPAEIKRLVAGSNITLSADGNGNVQIASSGGGGGTDPNLTKSNFVQKISNGFLGYKGAPKMFQDDTIGMYCQIGNTYDYMYGNFGGAGQELSRFNIAEAALSWSLYGPSTTGFILVGKYDADSENGIPPISTLVGTGEDTGAAIAMFQTDFSSADESKFDSYQGYIDISKAQVPSITNVGYVEIQFYISGNIVMVRVENGVNSGYARLIYPNTAGLDSTVNLAAGSITNFQNGWHVEININNDGDGTYTMEYTVGGVSGSVTDTVFNNPDKFTGGSTFIQIIQYKPAANANTLELQLDDAKQIIWLQ